MKYQGHILAFQKANKEHFYEIMNICRASLGQDEL